jgi:hypothetical protein
VTVQTIQPARPVSPFVEPWKPSPRATLITSVVIALLIVISTASFVVRRIWFTPESVVNGYYAALADRDAQQALTYGGNGDTTAADLIGSDKYVPPTKFNIDKIDGSKDDRTAKVGFVIGDNKVSGEVSLHRKDKLTWGLFRGWELTGDRPTIDINTTAPVAVQVNGHVLNVDDESSRHLAVFPGRYVVGLVDNPLVESDPVTVDAAFGDSTADLVPRIKAEATTTVDAQIKTYLKGCLIAATKPKNNCPFSINFDVTRPAWRIDKYPTVELRLADDGNVAAETTSEGKATLTGLGYGGYAVNEPTSFSVSGPVTVEQGAIKFQPE